MWDADSTFFFLCACYINLLQETAQILRTKGDEAKENTVAVHESFPSQYSEYTTQSIGCM